MITADENLHGKFIEDLRKAGFSVSAVAENFRGISDSEVVKVALKDASILITEDKDFGELIFAHKIARLTIVFLRYRKEELNIVRRQLLEVVNEYQFRSGNFFITISRGKVRVNAL